MVDIRAGSLLVPIKQATELGNLGWEEDPTGGFAVTLGENTINIYEMNDIFAGGNRRRESHTLRILNEGRKVVEFIKYNETNSSFSEIRSLYALVRRQVLKADVVLGDILHRLNTAL